MTLRATATTAVFLLTYVLIAARRVPFLPIGRAAGAMFGAVLMVAIGALSPKDSYAAVDHNTLVLLFGMMMLTAYLARAGFFDRMAQVAIARAGTPWRLLVGVSVLSAVLSAVLVNDTVCVFMTAAVIAICRGSHLPMGPYLIALGTAANIGSAATIVGNPQNMIIGSLSKIGFVEFLALSAPAAAVGLAVNLALLWLYYGRKLPATMGEGPRATAELAAIPPGDLRAVLVVTAGIVAGFVAGLHLGYTTLAGVLVLVIRDRREPREAFAYVDWPLLVFFSSLFIVVAGFERTGLVSGAWTLIQPHIALADPAGAVNFTAAMTAGSNLVSNVPLVLLAAPHVLDLGPPRLTWVMLAFVTTVAGNLTLVGSVANLIVAERAKDDYQLGFFEYLRFGVVSTLAVLAAGVPVIWYMAR
jgi:Na+/H+ antiporter NhaD/arsenite permease-like protein